MKKIIKLICWFIFIAAFFTFVRIMAIYYYHIQQAEGDYDLAMTLMDKAHIFNLPWYITGWLHCASLCMALKIWFNK